MFAKAFANTSGRNLAKYMMRPKENERVELVELRGFASDDIHEAFRSVDAMALGTKGTQPMFHVAVRNRAGEHLTDEQWLQVADRIESKLGLSGQPRGITFHVDEKTGDRHMHCGWSRLDAETMTLKNLPFFKVRLKEVCREMEWKFGLEIVGNDRKGPGRAPKRYEEEQARQRGVDLRTVREKIIACWQRSDDGKSFRAALEAEGFELLKGDRRDYVVMDDKGGIHALGQRLLGVKVAEIKARLSDLDNLLTVEQAREQRRTGMRDQHAANLGWEDAIAAASIAKEKVEGRFEALPRFSMDEYEHLAPAVLEEVAQHRATFNRFDIARALKPDIENDLDREGLARAILERPDVIQLGKTGGKGQRYTTQSVLDSEQHVADLAEALNMHDWHDVPAQSVEIRAARLSPEQAKALSHITARTGIAILDGQAGTGKTSLLAVGREVYETNGCRVVGLAHQNQAAEGLKEKGFAGARTIDSEMWALDHGRTQWTARTVVMVDEAATVDTRRLGMILAHAQQAGAKVVLAGDDRQLSSIERGGMFEVLKQRYSAAELTEVHRQKAVDEREASQLMAKGEFAAALGIYAAKGAVHWAEKQPGAEQALVGKYLADRTASPDKTRFVFAYTNDEVSRLNATIRHARIDRGELSSSQSFETKHGRAEFAVGDRLQFTGTDKLRGIYNGYAGEVRNIKGTRLTVAIDGRGTSVEFDADHFQAFRHGYAGTIYKGQGRTIDQTYLLNSPHWRNTSSYVALTRHSHKTELFVARETAPDLQHLARQMSRIDERSAASYFAPAQRQEGGKPLSPQELTAWWANENNRARTFQADRAEFRERQNTTERGTARPQPGNRASEIRAAKVGRVAARSRSGVRAAFSLLGSLLNVVLEPTPGEKGEHVSPDEERRYTREMDIQARERSERLAEEKENERRRRDYFQRS